MLQILLHDICNHAPVTAVATICCMCCCIAQSDTHHGSFDACFQMLIGGVGCLQGAASPSDGAMTIPGLTRDGDNHTMSHRSRSSEAAPEAAREAGECTTAGEDQGDISQEGVTTSTSSDAESPSLPPLSMTQQALVGAGRGGIWRTVCCYCHCHGGCSCRQNAATPNHPTPKASLFLLVVIR